MKDTFKQLIDEFNNKEKELVNYIRGEFGAACKEFFEKYPSLNSFSWRQYTRYFNDGDECYFSAHCDSYGLNINGLGYYKSEKDPISKEISKFLCSIGDNMLEKIFGDHAEIIVTKDGVTIESYEDHD